MREITETHIIELIKKYAKGGGGLYNYFCPMNICLWVSKGNKLCDCILYCSLEEITSDNWKYLVCWSDVLANYANNQNVVPSGTSWKIIFPYITNAFGDGYTSLYPMETWGQMGVAALAIPPKHMAWSTPDGTSRSDIGSLLHFGDFVNVYNNDLGHLIYHHGRGYHDGDLSETITDYLTIDEEYVDMGWTIDGTSYIVDQTGPNGGKIHAVVYTFTTDTDIEYNPDDPDYPYGDGVCKVGSEYVDSWIYV